ncbi:MAG: glutamate mutase L, partial [Clostridiales Family XIII bacterium]|nr:glutamate mutase L [Clostridiales Family XIII bacterium]
MSEFRVFIDFGSTFTKCVVFDLESETLAARVQTPSTVDSDITVGLGKALDEAARAVPIGEAEIRGALACSSAAGGLRMVCIGLVPDYTTKAGRLAALGAGAKVVGTFSFELSSSELRELEALAPDIVLLTGGTDGGNRRAIVRNAELLAGSPAVHNVIAAGNKSARDEIEAAFANSGKNLSFAKNVMPEFGVLELAPVNEQIRELFIGRITEAKGIARVTEIIGGVLMPTPAAVFEAARLIAEGTSSEAGLGELLLVDVGGATTDVYSVASGAPTRADVRLLGLAEPRAKRTVEGDLGLFHNLDTLADLALESELFAEADREAFDGSVKDLRALRSVPDGDALARCQHMLARLAVKTAAERHAGRLEAIMTGEGEVFVQRGKDLTGIATVLGAGGPLAFSSDPRYVIEGVAQDAPGVLTPRDPKFLLDSTYILFAVGLLARSEPAKALRIVKKYLK